MFRSVVRNAHTYTVETNRAYRNCYVLVGQMANMQRRHVASMKSGRFFSIFKLNESGGWTNTGLSQLGWHPHTHTHTIIRGVYIWQLQQQSQPKKQDCEKLCARNIRQLDDAHYGEWNFWWKFPIFPTPKIYKWNELSFVNTIVFHVRGRCFTEEERGFGRVCGEWPAHASERLQPSEKTVEHVAAVMLLHILGSHTATNAM